MRWQRDAGEYSDAETGTDLLPTETGWGWGSGSGHSNKSRGSGLVSLFRVFPTASFLGRTVLSTAAAHPAGCISVAAAPRAVVDARFCARELGRRRSRGRDMPPSSCRAPRPSARAARSDADSEPDEDGRTSPLGPPDADDGLTSSWSPLLA